MKKPVISPVVQLMDLVWASALQGSPHSWERLNHSMRSALELSIGFGFAFAEGDVAHVLSHYRSGYWIGESDEWIYSLAIAVENGTAVKSFEAYRTRTPFIADNVALSDNSGFSHGDRKSRSRERLAVGFSFPWQGVKVSVTSFAADSSHLIACSYRHGTHKVAKRFRITREEIISDRSARKAKAKAAEAPEAVA
jgi:hypothetical protein